MRPNWKYYAMQAKYTFNRGASHVNLARSIAEPVLLAGILLKLFGIESVGLMLGLGVVLIIGTYIIGWLDVKYGIARIETSIGNAQNPELLQVLEQTKGGKP